MKLDDDFKEDARGMIILRSSQDFAAYLQREVDEPRGNAHNAYTAAMAQRYRTLWKVRAAACVDQLSACLVGSSFFHNVWVAWVLSSQELDEYPKLPNYLRSARAYCIYEGMPRLLTMQTVLQTHYCMIAGLLEYIRVGVKNYVRLPEELETLVMQVSPHVDLTARPCQYHGQ